MEGEHIEHFNFRGYIWRSTKNGKVGVYIFPCNPETPNKQEDWQVKIPMKSGQEISMTSFIARMMGTASEMIEKGEQPLPQPKKDGFTFDSFNDEQ